MGIGLSALWRSVGVEPAAVVGHSQGEVVAGVVSGALTLEQGAQIVARRSQAVLGCAGRGGMALVERPVAVVEEYLAPYGDALSVAAVNTTGSTVISGQAEAIARIVSELQAQDVYARKINVDYASHNAQMDPLLPGLAEQFAQLTPREADIAFYSTVTGEVAAGPELDGTYWCRNLREPVRFDRALGRLLDDGHTVFVEISAHPVLSMPLTDGSSDRGGVVVGSLSRRSGSLAQLLRNLGLLHVQGHELDWDKVLGTGTVVPLPTYAFQREHYWMDTPKPAGDAGSLGLDASPHPWIGAVTPLADGEGHLITGRLSLADQPWLKDHTVFGSVIVPGTGLLELAAAAAYEVGAVGVAQLTLAEPLVIDDAVRLQITVGAPDATGRRTVAVHSSPEAAPADWTRHASGELRDADDTRPTPVSDPAFAELRGWPVAGTERVELDGFYDRFAAQGIEYGPVFRGLTELWRKGDTAYGVVRLHEAATGSDFLLHPALLDTALHIMKGAAQEAPEPEGALLPFEWSDVELHAAGGGELRVRIDVSGAEGTPEIRVWACDPAGEPVVRIGALHLRRATAAQLRAARGPGADGLHRLEFQPVPAPAPRGPVADAVLGGTGALAARLGVPALADVEELTAGLGSGAPARVVVDATGRPPFDSPPEAAYRATEFVLAQLQALLADERLASTELVWVTRQAAAAAPEDRLDGLPHAPLWGLLRSARAEHPERGLRLVDLGPDDVDRDALARALAVTGEPELAVRAGEVRAARLVRAAAPPEDAAVRPLDPEGSVLITGGTGELGRETARHLVRHHGVRHLVLTSRRGPDAPGAEELVRELQAEGAQHVRVVACDVARRDDVAHVLGVAEPGHPWTAVLHLAGVLDDGVVQGQDARRLSRVMAPKATGVHHLDELTRDLDLAAFVLFSSAAGTLGTAGQSVYGSANAYLDAFAAHRRAHGRPVTSLAWGLWHQAGVGMTSHLGAVEFERMRRQGIAPLPFEQGLALLDAVLARPADTFVPVRLDLRAVQRDADQGGDVPALFRTLVRPRLRRAGGPAGTATAATGLRELLLAAPAEQHTDLVTRVVLREVATVLGVSDAGTLSPQQVLKDLGLDSLMAVELRRRLSAETGLSLPATLAFDYPTPEHIARLVLGRLDLPAPAPALATTGDTAAAEDPDALLAWALERLSADRIRNSGLLERLVELAGQQNPAAAPAAVTTAAPPAEDERSVDDINAELNALLEASGLDLD
jgi:malonyl CoA-acyl carrier protein transacylase